MRLPKIFLSIAAAMMLLIETVHAEPKAIDFIDGVDWTRNVVTVNGDGIAPIDTVNSTQSEGLAVKAAQVDAYRKLGEIINGVRVESNMTIEKLTVQKQIKLRVEATIKGARIIDQERLTDGAYRIIMQVPLFGKTNSLADAVFQKSPIIEPFPAPVYNVAPSVPPYDKATPVRQRLEFAAQVEDDPLTLSNDESPLSRVKAPTIVKGISGEPVKKSVTEYAALAKGDYTGLIVDCRGLSLQPVMSPIILNTNGTKIFGHKNIDVDKIVEQGMVDYVTDPEKVSRAGDNPLVVKAVKLEDFNSNPVLSLADSNRVLIENHATKFLKDLKVVFLFD